MPRQLILPSPTDFREFPKSAIFQGIHERIQDIADRYPNNIAIRENGLELTYSRMNGFANTIADAILTQTGTDLAQAAILLPNTAMTILSMLGALKARKAYVPMDLHFPQERLRAMAEDADPALVLTDTERMPLAERLTGGRIPLLDVGKLRLDAAAANPKWQGEPMDRAYILYTSGSTGRPKGIEFLHRNLLHTTMCLTNRLFYAASDRVTWLHSPTFGSSIVDIYCCLTNGATLLPWDVKANGFNGMAQWMKRERATAFHWIPSAFRQFVRTVEADSIFDEIRIVVMAGEPLTIREVEMFRQHFARGHHLVNQVGTGESYNYYLYYVDHELEIEGAGVPGGYPVSSEREVLILDESRKPLPVGHTGEIAIKSDYMAAGYWRNPEQTAEKFLRSEDGCPIYLTGDLGQIGADGCLMHLGRKDFQLKIRGCRVEVAEVEHLLGGREEIADAAVWIAKNRAGEDQLVAYVVLKSSAAFDRAAIVSSLAKYLPDYMVPQHLVVMDALPVLPTGKVNRRDLPNPFQNAGATSTLASSNEIENEIVGYFRELLQLPDAGPGTDFVSEGGDSLMGAVLIEKIFRRYGVTLGFEEVGLQSTPARIALTVANALAGGQRAAAKTAVTAPSRQFDQTGVRESIKLTLSTPASAATIKQGRTRRTRARVRDLIIVGAGQCGREIYTWAEQAIAAGARLHIKGFLDTRKGVLSGYDDYAGILATSLEYSVQSHDVFVGALGDPRDKVKFYSPIVAKGGKFINIIHPLANVGKNVRLGDGVVLAPFASITSDVRVGSHVSVGAFSNLAHDTVVGDWSQISSHCGVNGMAALAEGVFLGSHACVIPGITVGPWAYVGAGSVVVRPVERCSKVFGNPARAMGEVAAAMVDG